MSRSAPTCRISSLALVALLACGVAHAGTEITYRGFVKEMRAQDIDVRHITEEGVAASYDRLAQLLTAKIADRDLDEGKAALLRSGLRGLDRQREAPALDRRAAYVAALRGLYSVEAEPFEGTAGFWTQVRDRIRGLARFWTNTPRLTPDALDMTHAEYVRTKRPRNKVEAQGLVDEQGSRVSLASLEDQTIRQIADLDVAPDHPTWLQEKERSRTAAGAWEGIERRVESLAQRSQAGYRLDTARRVLFFDKVKDIATSAKVDAEDAFGFKWKIKFGNQAQPEPITSRLFALLGQKFVDLVYTNGRGGEELVLLLPKGEEVEHLAKKFAESKYHFDLTPYLDATGVVTEVRGGRLIGSSGDELAPLPTGASVDPAGLVGRAYMTFKESEVEFQGGHDVYARVGPVAKNFAGAEDDRGERAGLIANMWVNNFDAKDENSRTIVIPEVSEEAQEVLEIYHDLGGTLGGQFGDFGRVNKLKTGEKFLSVGRGSLKFKQFMLYRPKAWKKMTVADGLWMARKVASVTRAQVEEAVAHSHLPAFVQDVYVYKILDRRDRIAFAYGLTVPDETPAPTVDIDLSPVNRPAVARSLGLDARLLDDEVEQARGHGFEGDVDHVVVDGQLSDCQDSVLLGLLESELYPSGLTRRIKSTKDDKPLPRCRYGVKPKRY